MPKKDQDPKYGLSDHYRRPRFPKLKGPTSRIKPVKPIEIPKEPFVLRRRGIRIEQYEWRAALERRAVPKHKVYGTLSERIVYKEFRRRGFDFDFQSSLLGGRQQLGGKVADFILYMPYGPVIVRVQSYAFHSGWAARKKDEEDKRVLESIRDSQTGQYYIVYDLWEDVVFDAERLAEWIDRYLLGNYLGQGLRAPRGGVAPMVSAVDWRLTQEKIQAISDRLDDLAEQVGWVVLTVGGPTVPGHFVIDSLNIRDLAVTTAKIDTLAVTNAKINDCNVGKLTAGNLTVAATITTGGSIQVGSGTKDDDLTGFIIDSTELVGQNSGTDQIVLASGTGALTAGAGAVLQDANGITLDEGQEVYNSIKWKSASGYVLDFGTSVVTEDSTDIAQTTILVGRSGSPGNPGRLILQAKYHDGTTSDVRVERLMDGYGTFTLNVDDVVLNACPISFSDTNTQIWEDASSNLSFKDANAGTKTLFQLTSPKTYYDDGTNGSTTTSTSYAVVPGLGASITVDVTSTVLIFFNCIAKTSNVGSAPRFRCYLDTTGYCEESQTEHTAWTSLNCQARISGVSAGSYTASAYWKSTAGHTVSVYWPNVVVMVIPE